MTFQTYLKINGTALPVQKDDYSVDYSDVIADSGGVTEAGTTVRDVIREGIPSISVSLPVSVTWLKKLRRLKKEPYLNVEWMNPETGVLHYGDRLPHQREKQHQVCRRESETQSGQEPVHQGHRRSACTERGH